MMVSSPSPTHEVGSVGTSASLAASTIGAAAMLFLAAPRTLRAQQASLQWSCFSEWTVATTQDSEPFRVSSPRWALRWRRTTPRHSDLDELFVEVYRAVGDSTPKEDQAAAINTDHDGEKGTIIVDEKGAFWLHMESWSQQTKWRVEACRPGSRSDSAHRTGSVSSPPIGEKDEPVASSGPTGVYRESKATPRARNEVRELWRDTAHLMTDTSQRESSRTGGPPMC